MKLLKSIFFLLQILLCNGSFSKGINLSNCITFTNGSLVINTFNLKVNFDLINSQYLIIYNTLSQKVKKIAINNPMHIFEDVSTLSNGEYYISINDKSINPLKFIKSN